MAVETKDVVKASGWTLEGIADVGATAAVYVGGVIVVGWLIPKEAWVLGSITPWVVSLAGAVPMWKYMRRTKWVK